MGIGFFGAVGVVFQADGIPQLAQKFLGFGWGCISHSKLVFLEDLVYHPNKTKRPQISYMPIILLFRSIFNLIRMIMRQNWSKEKVCGINCWADSE